MAKNLYRYARSTYGKKGELLPLRLGFLAKIPFTSVIEDHRDARTQIRVELLASTLRGLLATVQRHAKIEKLNQEVLERKDRDIERIRMTVDQLKKEWDDWIKERDLAEQSAERANVQLREIESLRKMVCELEKQRDDLIEARDQAVRSAENANGQLAQLNESRQPVPGTEASGPLAGYLARADDRGFKPHGRPLPGGLPSLPKKR